MKYKIQRTDERGIADHGWLHAKFSFSFAQYYNPERLHFGALRVLNNDIIEPAKGFGTHPHDNMEIVTIPLKGKLAHKDSRGHEEIIHPGEVQVMSAGTGIYHSEYNASATDETELFQVWVLPDKNGHEPRYDQMLFDSELRKNKIHNFVHPEKKKDTLWLNQDAYFSWGEFDEDLNIDYELFNKNNGLFIMNIDGQFEIENEIINKRDSIEIENEQIVSLKANQKSFVLFIEVPMYKLR